MNIMLVAVTERTREIGLRKARRQRQSEILLQFCRIVLACSLGGVAGVFAGMQVLG